MPYSLIIRIFNDDTLKNGEFYYSKEFYREIITHFPDIIKLQLDQISQCVVIFAKPADFSRKALNVKICNLKIGNESISIKFNDIKETQLLTSEIRKSLYNKLNESHILKDIRFLPVVCLLNEGQAEYILHQRSEQEIELLHKIQKYQKDNDWNSIYKIFTPISNIKNDAKVWNDLEILSILGFALGKLAETTELPKAIFKDETRKKEFLKNQLILRNETELIRKRVVEINPQNASSWSNLAYFYYQNTQELSVNKGRRDGNIINEIEKAIFNINKALSIDESRITDLYRKGRLLSRILPKNILFGKKTHDHDYKKINKLVYEKKLEGIAALKQALKIWESLDENDKRDNDKKNRTRNSYIESLYNLGKVYFDFVSSDWDESVFLLHLRHNVSTNDKISYIPQDFENINESIKHFENCCCSDSGELLISKTDLIENASFEGIISAVDKLYSLGKVYFTKYWILSGYGQKDTPENLVFRNKAKEYYKKALIQQWPSNKSKQKKDFIAERLARVFISEGNYKEAISCIIQNCGNEIGRIQPFVLNTFSLAYTLDKQYLRAQEILRTASANKFNLGLWQTYFILGCTFLLEGNLTEASENYRKAENEAQKIGKRTVDSFIIAQAFIQYKLNNKGKAIEFLKCAHEINPYRISINKRLVNWEKNNVEDN